MKKVVTVILLLALTFTLFLQGCSKDSKDDSKNNTLIYAAETEYEKINPALDTTNVDDLIFRGLMRFDKDNIPQKDIAESYEVSQDGLVYDFKIKKGIKFHDGKELKAEDVVFTLNTILDEKSASKVKADFQEVKSVEKLGDYELKITLKDQFPPLLDKLTVGIIPKHAFNGKDVKTADFNKEPMGCGPYKYDKWEKGKSLTLKANKDFYGKVPSIEKVIFKFIPDGNVRAMQLQTGEVDMAFIEPSQVAKIEKLSNIKVYKEASADYRCMMYNMKNEIFKDVNVRKALNYSIDRKAVVDSILMGYGFEAYSPLQINRFKNDNIEKYTYNIQSAEELLDKAGWVKGSDGMRYKNGKKLAFTITCPITDEVRVNLSNYIASQFKKVGADVKVDALDWSVIKIDKCDAFLLGFGSPYDADDHTYRLFYSSENGGDGYNFGSYSDPKVDELLTKGRITVDANERMKIYQDLQQQLAQNPPYNFIVYLQALYGVNKKVQGITEKTLGHHGAGFLWDLEDWSIND